MKKLDEVDSFAYNENVLGACRVMPVNAPPR